jgi:uncharacterized protein (DUF58 family)
MERLFIKLFQEEEDLTVHILIDASKSMDWGDPNAITLPAPITPTDSPTSSNPQSAIRNPHSETAGQNKLIYAKRVAAALGYISLTDLDRLSITAFSRSSIQRFTPVRGKGHAVSLLRFIAGVRAEGQTDLDLTLRQYATQAKYPGLLFLLSDCLVEDGGVQGLSALQAAGHEINLIHILSPAEVHPELALIGDLRLKDIETGATQDVSIDSAILDLYREKYEAWQGGIETFCRRRGINYLHVTTDQPFEDLVLHYLRRKGILT